MALERVPADISRPGRRRAYVRPGDDPGNPGAVTIPVMRNAASATRRGADPRGARSRLHRRVRGADARDIEHHVDKWKFTVAVRVRRDELGEALRRIGEGAAMIRTKGEGRAPRHRQRGHTYALVFVISAAHLARRGRAVRGGEEAAGAVRARALVRERQAAGRYVHRRRDATPADASLCMQLGATASSSAPHLQVGRPEAARKAIVEATTHFRTRTSSPRSAGLGERCRHLDADARSERAARDTRLVSTVADRVSVFDTWTPS